MRRLLLCVVLGLGLVATVGCAVHTHTVGKGAQANVAVSARQWYVLWGLVTLNEADAGKMALGVEDYTIVTKLGFVDVIINFFLGLVSINTRSVSVIK